MKFIITKFILNDQKNDQGSADANSKSRNIDHCKDLIAAKASECRKKIIFEHGYLIAALILQHLCQC